MKQLITIKEAVREVLEESPKARNNDTLLIILTLRKFGHRIYIDNFKQIPSMASIVRSRRFWQNKCGYCTPEEDIDIARNKRQFEYKEVFA